MPSRTRRIYSDIGVGNFSSDGQAWNTPQTLDMTSGYATISYAITIGSGAHTESFSEITIWQNGVISLGAATAAQITFMSSFAGSQTLSGFPGDYISAGYTDESGKPVSDGGDAGYGAQVVTGDIEFNPQPDGSYDLSDATPVTRIDWGQNDGAGDFFVDKQVIFTASDFTIDDTNYDSQGAGYGFGRITVNGADQTIPGAVSDSGDYFAYVRDDLYEHGLSDMLLQNTAGAVAVGELADGGAAAFTYVSDLGPEWKFVGVGDYLGLGYTQFLMENTAGAVVVGDASNGQATFSYVSGLGPEWSFAATGDFLGDGKSDFLIENTAGAVALGEVVGGQASYTYVSSLGPEWKFVGAGDFLDDGKDGFLIENTAGAVALGEIAGGQASYSYVAALGPEWKFVGAGDFLGDGKDDFLIENTAGAVAVGEVGSNGQASYTFVANLGPEWTFVGSGDYLGEGHDQFLIENTAGAVVVGDWTGGAIHYTEVAALGPEWVFHN